MKRSLKILSIPIFVGVLFLLGGCGWLFNKPPVAEFTWEPLQPMAGEEVTFDASSSYDPEGCILQYQWNFGDGTTASGEIVKHIFIDDGTYTVTLTVEDKWGEKDTKTQTITVLNPPPELKWVTVTDLNGGRIEVGDILQFEVKGIDPASLGLKYIASYHWDFGDGTQATGRIVTHSYECSNNKCTYYTVTVTLIDDDGASSSYSFNIKVYPKDRPPIPSFEFIIDGNVLKTVNHSRDNDLICTYGRTSPYRIVRSLWSLYLNGKLIYIISAKTLTYELTQTGSYRIVLEVEDDEGNIRWTARTFTYP